MRIAYTDEQEALRRELREYYADLLDPDTERQLSTGRGIGPVMRRVVKQMATDGWLGIGWPKEYGGQGRGPMEQFIFFDESMRAGAPVPMLTINTVGPTIMNFGTDEQKDRFLPRILAGDIHFCIGYSEPGAGTDLAALRTTAVRDGDDYVINGQKMWTSLANDADYCWLAVRTNPEVKKHQGLSMIIVPMDTPGIEIRTLDLIGEHDIAAVFYDDVRVPAANLVGGENNGWTLITNQLNHERVTICSPGMVDRHLLEVRHWAQTTHPPRRHPGHRRALGAGQPGQGARRLRVPAADELEGGLAGRGGHAVGRRRQHHQGVRHRALHGRHQPAARGAGRARLPQARHAGRACCGHGSRACTAASRSSRSAAARTRSNET